MTIILSVILGIMLVTCCLMWYNYKNVVDLYQDTNVKLETEIEKNKTILSQKKSSETRLGQMSEHLIPFLDGFPHDPKNCHFLGMPIDLICFDFDEGKITFIEVKTGNARESERQKKIKNIIKNGHVYYERFRLNEKGLNVKEEKNND